MKRYLLSGAELAGGAPSLGGAVEEVAAADEVVRVRWRRLSRRKKHDVFMAWLWLAFS